MARRSRRRTRRVGLGGVLLFVGATVAVLAALWWSYRLIESRTDRRAGNEGPAHGSEPSPERPSEAPPATTPPSAASSSSPDVPPGETASSPPQVVQPSEPEPFGERPYPRPAVPLGGPPPEPQPVSGEVYVAVVIDDLGRSLQEVARLRSLGVPLSYAVLPFETRTGEVVAELDRWREEVLLHLPMQGSPGADPGPGALRTAMGDDEIGRRTRAALAAVPNASGVNNHMGSVLTSDRRAMTAVLGVLAERGLFFLDSRTSAETVGYAAARNLGVAAAERHVFLDPDPDVEAIRGQFYRLLDLARREGSGIAIGHPYPSTMTVLDEEVPRARELGYTFVAVSDLLERPGELP